MVSEDPSNESSVRFLSILRLARVVRLLTLMRLFRFFRELVLLMKGILGAMRALIWAMMLMGLVIYISGVLMTKIVSASEIENTEVLEWFGTLPRSLLTLFQIMTLESWPTVARVTMQN